MENKDTCEKYETKSSGMFFHTKWVWALNVRNALVHFEITQSSGIIIDDEIFLEAVWLSDIDRLQSLKKIVSGKKLSPLSFTMCTCHKFYD